MEVEYHEITTELDAREVLRYLNYLGIQNISGEVLKYFITDLKKLIKYDLEKKSCVDDDKKCNVQWPERLHSASTFSSRIRSKTQDEISLCTKECEKTRKPLIVRQIRSAPNLGQKNVPEKLLRRACSCVREVKVDLKTKENKGSSSSNNNLIKVPMPVIKKKCDPVSLYHYYTSLWAKYKSNVPGENKWSDLRWNIRQKMAGASTQSLKITDSVRPGSQERKQ